MPHQYSRKSLDCLAALPGTTPIACSTDIGWTSLLVRHSRSIGCPDPHDTIPSPDHKLVVLTRGEVNVDMFKGGLWRRAVYRAGTSGLSVPGEIDRLRLNLRGDADTFEKIHILLPYGLVDEAAEHLRRPGQTKPVPSLVSATANDQGVAQIALSLLIGLRRKAPEFFAETAAQWLALELLTRNRGFQPDDDLRCAGSITDARLRRALDYMSANLDRPLTLEAVAAEAGVSKFHFTRLFRRRVGVTPMRHLSDLRLSTAAHLLRTTDLPAGQIAHACGILNTAHFSDAFRRRYGCSPGRFRAET